MKSEFNLMFGKVVLPNAARVMDFAKDKDCLKLVLLHDKNINISINTITKVVRTTISNSSTVEKLKLTLLHEYSVKIPLDEQILLNDDGKIMSDMDMPVHWYGVKEGSFLDMDTKTFRLRICDETDQTLHVLVDPSHDTIKSLKYKICHLLPVPRLGITEGQTTDSGPDCHSGNGSSGTGFAQHCGYHRYHRDQVHPAAQYLTLFMNIDLEGHFEQLEDEKLLSEYKINRKSIISLISYKWVDENHFSLQLATKVAEHELPKDHLKMKGLSASSKSGYNSSGTSNKNQQEKTDFIVFGEKLFFGCKSGDTVKSVGLRAQEQLGIAYNVQEFAELNKVTLQKLTAQGCMEGLGNSSLYTVKDGSVLPFKGAVNFVSSTTKLRSKTSYVLFVNDIQRDRGVRGSMVMYHS